MKFIFVVTINILSVVVDGATVKNTTEKVESTSENITEDIQKKVAESNDTPNEPFIPIINNAEQVLFKENEYFDK